MSYWFAATHENELEKMRVSFTFLFVRRRFGTSAAGLLCVWRHASCWDQKPIIVHSCVQLVGGAFLCLPMNDVEIADRTCYYCHYRPVCDTRLLGRLHLFQRLVHVPDSVIFSAKFHPKRTSKLSHMNMLTKEESWTSKNDHQSIGGIDWRIIQVPNAKWSP